MGLSDGLARRLERRPLLRWALYATLGVGVFMIGASYLRLQVRPDPVGFQVIGSDLLASGWDATLRIRARTAHLGHAHAVSVTGLTIGGVAVPFDTRQGDPLRLSFRVPPLPSPAPLRVPVALTLSAGPRTETITFEVAATAADPAGETPRIAAPPWPKTARSLRLEVLPEHGDLISHLDNRVFVAVRHLDGSPARGAARPLLPPPLGARALPPVPHGAGLATFTVTPRLPNIDLRVVVALPGHLDTPESFLETLYTAGRQLTFEGLPPVIPPRTSPTMHLRTTRDSGQVYCDLRRGRQLLESWQLPLDAELDLTLSLPPLFTDGRYDLQCYLNPLIPGSTFASRAFWVGDPADAAPLVDAAVSGGHLPILALTVPTPTPELLAPYLAARLSDRKVLSTVLLQTFDAAVADADARWDRAKDIALLTLGGVIFLIVLVGFDLVLSNILANRRRFRTFEAELAEEGDTGGPISLDGVDAAKGHTSEKLSRTRGWLFIIVAIGTVVANAIGFLLLSGMFRT